MKNNGFTLYELLITLTVIAITLAIGIPSLNKTIQDTRTKTASLALLESIETTRSTAVFHNQNTILKATNKKWHEGWTLFIDNNNNGLIDKDDKIIAINKFQDLALPRPADDMAS